MLIFRTYNTWLTKWYDDSSVSLLSLIIPLNGPKHFPFVISWDAKRPA